MSVFNPNGVCFPSTEPGPEPEAVKATCAPPPPEEDPAGGLLNFFKGGDPVEKCLHYPTLRGYVTDEAFCRRLRKLRHEAEAAKTPEQVSELTRRMMNDPRLTQCSMAGAGMTLTVEDHDLKKAERLGDIEKMSPIRAEDVVRSLQECKDKEAAKKRGNELFAKGDHAGALAYWARAMRFDREARNQDDIDMCGAIYCNMALALLKLNYPQRAEQAATRAVKHCDYAVARAYEAKHQIYRKWEWGEIDGEPPEPGQPSCVELAEREHPALNRVLLDGATRRKALYRRALAREKLRRFNEAYADCAEARRLAEIEIETVTDLWTKEQVPADPFGVPPKQAPTAEKKLLREELKRLKKLKDAEDEEIKKRALRKAEEAQVAYQRHAGIKLKEKKTEGRQAPGASVGYLEEKDFSRWALTRLAALLEGVDVDLGKGARVRVTDTLKRQSTVHASVTHKRGARALYYDIDVHATWTASPPKAHELKMDDDAPARLRPKPLEGTVRLYNVSQETTYEPGADTNVAYMYQLGYKGLDPKWFDGARATEAAPPWARLLVNGAHELFEALAMATDKLIAELKKK